MQKPSNAKGTRDFSPEVVKKRNYILDTIRTVFEKYGFAPLQTPAIENLSTLTGKYGAEGDKLLFKILNSGDVSRSLKAEYIDNGDNSKLINALSEKGLRYDLTVPFARYVVQHRNDISFPFRRYQIQEVWRADKPQKGRYREFTQCDADIIGSQSLLNEADLVLIYNEVFSSLGLSSAVLKINHRKFLEAMVDELKLEFAVTKFTSTLDKFDKIGKSGVIDELQKLGVDASKSESLFKFINQVELSQSSLDQLAEVFNQNTHALGAIDDLGSILKYIANKKLNIKIQLDLSLARGLDYYTGCIFEAIIPDSGIGSVSGGGRYDDLTSVFGLKDVSGVGISFGIDRIYDVLESGNMFSEEVEDQLDVLLCHFDEKAQQYAFDIANELRSAAISCMVFPDNKNIKKQFNYADKIGVKYCITIGDDEMASGSLSIKNMKAGSNTKLSLEELIDKLQAGESI